jgi:hypothetical protein
MPTRHILLALPVMIYLMLIGCGKNNASEDDTAAPASSSDIDQMYQVTSYTQRVGSCGSEGDPFPFGEPYFILRTDVNGGIGYHICRAVDDCDEVRALDLSFSRPVNDTWFTELGDYGCCDEGTCAVFKTSNTLWFEGDDTVRIERTACLFDYGEESSEEACDAKVDTSPTCDSESSGCNELNVLIGTPI